MRCLLGFDIGGTKCAVALGRAPAVGTAAHAASAECIPVKTDACASGSGGRLPETGASPVLARFQTPTDLTLPPLEMLRRLAEEGRRLLAEAGADPVPAGIGISCGGPLSSARGLILSPPNLPGWDNVPAVQWLSDFFHAPAVLENDANACALAEHRYGAARGTQNAIFLTFGTGMGAGLILDGRLYRGTNDLGGEAGHIRVAEDGPVGFGKAGSFEGYCSGGGIARLAQARIRALWAAGRQTPLCPDEAALEQISARTLAAAADAGDPLALEIWAASGRMLGRGLAILIDLLNPQIIVIGSIFQRSGHLLRAAMEQELKAEALAGALAVCRIVPAALGDDIGDYAALALAAMAAEENL